MTDKPPCVPSVNGKTGAVTRPVLRWHGGKWLLAPWIIDHFPEHQIYVEGFGGAASVLLRKPRCYSEVYNDLDYEAVTLFRVLRDPERASELQLALSLTPYSRVEFEASYKPGAGEIEIARCLVVRSLMSFGSDGHNTAVKTGFRANASRSGTTPAHDWMHYPQAIPLFVERLRGVTIESRDALKVMQQQDGPDTLHYVDPPYMPATRSQKRRRGKKRYHAYKHEMDEEDHLRLLEGLLALEGMVVVSGYPSALYNSILKGWQRVRRAALADGARKRTEVLWINPLAWDRQPQPSFL